jgi:hypothetical protein
MSDKTARASLRFFSGEPDPDFIAAALDAKPTRRICKGDLLSPRNRNGGRFEYSQCNFASPLPEGYELHEHIAWILDFLEGRRQPLDAIRARVAHMDIFCMFSSESGQGAAALNANLLQRLAGQHIDLLIDLYPPGGEMSDTCPVLSNN